MEDCLKYAIDTEFIDTAACSALISFAIVDEDYESLYFEFRYPHEELTLWLKENVVCQLSGRKVEFGQAAQALREFVKPSPEFWAYYGAYDWYWMCRLFSGMMCMPKEWPWVYNEFAHVQRGVENAAGLEHHALNDARSLMIAMKARNG